MPVIPHPANLFQDSKALFQFLLACQQKSLEKKQPQIASISLEMPPVDPLAVLDSLNQPDKLHFYFEKNRQTASLRPALRDSQLLDTGDAIAALDCAVHFTTEGRHRFTRAQEFIRTCLANTLSTGNLHLPYAGPHFFCSFTFFDQNLLEKTNFPAATVFLPRWQISRRKKSCVLVANLEIAPDVNLELLYHNFLENVQQILETKYRIADTPRNNNHLTKQPIAAANNFKNGVLSALESIQKNQYSKIVLADAIHAISKTPFNIVSSLNNLRKRHPDCYIFSTGNGQGKTFIGASPERLVSMENQVLATDALAGSAPRGKTPQEDINLAQELLNSEKERHEHQVVSEFIVQHLSKLGLVPLLSPPSRLLQLSNIQHLWTPIKAQVPPNVSLLDIVAELHPTPAVAGAPREIACQEIRRYENFERSLYAGPIGWTDRHGNGEFIVGIRSAIIEGNRARLCAGAGIVAGSDPEKELAEIQLKLQALLKALV